MIFDRTSVDVENAKKIREERIKKFTELTEDELNTLERGFITNGTIDRISEKQKELYERIKGLGYHNMSISTDSYGYEDFFKKGGLEKIIKNNEQLTNAFFVFASTPKTAKPIYHFEEINKIEKTLHDISLMIDDVITRFKRCGTFNCGEG